MGAEHQFPVLQDSLSDYLRFRTSEGHLLHGQVGAVSDVQFSAHSTIARIDSAYSESMRAIQHPLNPALEKRAPYTPGNLERTSWECQALFPRVR